MVTVTDPEELEKALADPEAYGHLIVRVGGYSEYFVKLPAEIQREVVRRTLY
jgi:pyruvate-formate lyase